MNAWWHLTFKGKTAAIWYALRRLFVRPADSDDRCFMGAPVHPMVHCPRAATSGFWCAKHEKSRRWVAP